MTGGVLAVSWTADGLIGRVTVDGEHWASVELSERHQRWCVDVSQGRCFKKVASIRGRTDPTESPGAGPLRAR
jgi:hypothetical protein